MPNDLQLSDQDEVLLESLVLAASDNVTRAPGSDRSQFAPTRRRVFVETDGNENVYLGTGNAWVDVSENTGLLSSLFGGGDGNFNSVNTAEASINQVLARGGLNTDQSIPNNTFTQLNITDANIEDSDVFDVDTTNNQIEVLVDGSYLCIVTVTWTGVNTFSGGDQLFINLSTFDEDTVTQHPGNSEQHKIECTGIAKLSANETISAEIRQRSGSSQDVDGFDDRTSIKVVRIG